VETESSRIPADKPVIDPGAAEGVMEASYYVLIFFWSAIVYYEIVVSHNRDEPHLFHPFDGFHGVLAFAAEMYLEICTHLIYLRYAAQRGGI